MKKSLILLSTILCLFLASCATTGNQTSGKASGSPALDDFPYTSYNAKAGDDLYMPVNCNYLFYGTTEYVDGDWDFSLPKVFGKKTLVTIFSYTYYFEGVKEEVLYEMIVYGVNLNKEFQNLEPYAPFQADTVYGTAAIDEPRIYIRTAYGLDPNLILDTTTLPVDVGEYTYFSAATFTSNCPKFLTYMPVTSKKDEIEFWDNPESIESLVNRSIGPDAATFNSFPMFNIMVKTKLTELPTPITSTNTTDLLLRKQFFSNAETEMIIDFDGIPFHIVFNKGFLDYLKGDYTLGDDIWLYLNGLYTANGVMTLNVRDYTTTSPEAYYDYKVDLIKKYRAENSQ